MGTDVEKSNKAKREKNDLTEDEKHKCSKQKEKDKLQHEQKIQ